MSINSPVWDIYDEFRTARLNIRYYEIQLSTLTRANNIMDIVIALSASSGIAGLWFWSTAIGNIIWKILMSLAAVIAVIKPSIKLSDQIQQKNEILTKWRLLEDGLNKLVISISQYRKYDDHMKKQFFTLLEIRTEIAKKEPSEKINEKLVKSCTYEVNRELPVENFFIPEDQDVTK